MSLVYYNINVLTLDGARKAAANSTFAIGGVSCSADTFVVAESFVIRINNSGKNPAHRKSANRYAACYDDSSKSEYLCI
jgi:hypothetical protein